MSIAKMQKLELIALESDREELLRRLLHLGCVEISEAPGGEWQDHLRRSEERQSDRQGQLRTLQEALTTLQKYAPEKTGLLSPRMQIGERDFLDEAGIRRALDAAESINAAAAEVHRLEAQKLRLEGERVALEPWQALDLPLEEEGSRTTAVRIGTLPAQADWALVEGALYDAVQEAALYRLSESAEQQCVLLLVLRSKEGRALRALRPFGFTMGQLTGYTGTVADNLRRLADELSATETERIAAEEKLMAYKGGQTELRLGIDRVTLEKEREENHRRLLTDGCIVCLDGWVPEKETGKLTKLLDGFDCDYALRPPTQEEYPEVPVKLENNFLTRCMNTITEMYSLPAYDGVDPNPLMAPFFILFFGIMMADMGYGLLMIVGTALFLKKKRPANPHFMELFFWCGISTFIMGALTGGFFGDFIPQLCRIIDPASTFTLPALFTPLDDTVAVMLGSLVLGLIQVITGMIVSVVKKTREGRFADALWDEITWWIILLGVGLMALGIGSVGGVPVVLCLGGVMLLIGSARGKKGFGIVTSLVGNIYNGVTGFFSDILSYVRLMALMLSGAVIAQVFNTLAATFGNVVLFVIISMIGNLLNLALNLLGCYVHDLRLQCLEFFGRFYQEGGKPYRPLSLRSDYVEIMKEEQ